MFHLIVLLKNHRFPFSWNPCMPDFSLKHTFTHRLQSLRDILPLTTVVWIVLILDLSAAIYKSLGTRCILSLRHMWSKSRWMDQRGCKERISPAGLWKVGYEETHKKPFHRNSVGCSHLIRTLRVYKNKLIFDLLLNQFAL